MASAWINEDIEIIRIGTHVYTSDTFCQLCCKMYQETGANAVDLSGNAYHLTANSDNASGPAQQGTSIRLRKSYHEYFSIQSASAPLLNIGKFSVAAYMFNSLTFLTDKYGTNDLTNTGASVDGDSMEGNSSAIFVGSQSDRMYRTDANLSSDFPFKGGSAGAFTISFWWKPGSSGIGPIISKRINSGCDFQIRHTGSSTVILIGYSNGASYDSASYATTYIGNDSYWYHISVAYDPSDRSYRMRIYDDNAGAQLGSDLEGTFSNAASGSGEDFYIGSDSNPNPTTAEFFSPRFSIDKLMIFDRKLTAEEMDGVREFSGNLGISLVGKIKLKSAPSTDGWGIISKHKANTGQGQYAVIAKDDGSGNNRLEFILSDDGTTEHTITSELSLALETWYTFVATYNKSHMRLYINEVENAIDAQTFEIHEGTAPIEVGRIRENLSTCADIECEFVGIFDKELSDDT